MTSFERQRHQRVNLPQIVLRVFSQLKLPTAFLTIMREQRTPYVFHESNFTNDNNVAFENRAKKKYIENKGQKSK